MTRKWLVFAMCCGLAGCGQIGLQAPSTTGSEDAATRPQARPDEANVSLRTPPATARTAEDFDTTTVEERAQAAAAPNDTGAEQALGATIVSLGDPARPGFWIETPLVSSPTTGRVAYPSTGQSSQVDLIPIDGPATAGSRMSLAAMRLIGVPLTGLAEVQVFSGG